jgi:molybdate transport system substrate-binding protein
MCPWAVTPCKILTSLGLDEAALEKAGKITYGSNVKEVTTQVRSGRGGLRHHLRHRRLLRTGRRQQDGSRCHRHQRIMCGQAALSRRGAEHHHRPTAKQDAAQAFLDYLRTDPCAAVFEKVGFTVVK